MQSRPQPFERSLLELLGKYDLSNYATHIMEEMIFHHATQKALPGRGLAFHASDLKNQDQFIIEYSDLAQNDVEDLQSFLKSTTHESFETLDPNAIEDFDKPNFITTVPRRDGSTTQDAILVVMDGALANNFLLPLLEPYIKELEEKTPEKFAEYQLKSRSCEYLQMFKLEKFFATIGQTFLNVEGSCQNEFIKGQIHILNEILGNDVGEYELHRLQANHDDCGYKEKEVLSNINRTNRILKENLAGNETAQNLFDHLSNYKATIDERKKQRLENNAKKEAEALKFLQGLSFFEQQPKRVPSPTPTLEDEPEEAAQNTSTCRIM